MCCVLENAVFVKDAKLKEIMNLGDYETFELVEDIGQECIRSR